MPEFAISVFFQKPIGDNEIVTYFEFLGWAPEGTPWDELSGDSTLEEHERATYYRPASTAHIATVFEFFGEPPQTMSAEGDPQSFQRRMVDWAGVYDTIDITIEQPNTGSKVCSTYLTLRDNWSILSNPSISSGDAICYFEDTTLDEYKVPYPWGRSPRMTALILVRVDYYGRKYFRWGVTDLIDNNRTIVLSEHSALKAVVNSDYLYPVTKTLLVSPVEFSVKYIGQVRVAEYRFRSSDLIPKVFCGIIGRFLLGWYHQDDPWHRFWDDHYPGSGFIGSKFVLSPTRITSETQLASLVATSTYRPLDITQQALLTLPSGTEQFIWAYYLHVSPNYSLDSISAPGMLITAGSHFLFHNNVITSGRSIIPQTSEDYNGLLNSIYLLYSRQVFGRFDEVGSTNEITYPPAPTIGPYDSYKDSPPFMLATREGQFYKIHNLPEPAGIFLLHHEAQIFKAPRNCRYDRLSEKVGVVTSISGGTNLTNSAGVITKIHALPTPLSTTSPIWHYAPRDLYEQFFTPSPLDMVVGGSSETNRWSISPVHHRDMLQTLVNPFLVKYFDPPIFVRLEYVWRDRDWCFRVHLSLPITGLVKLDLQHRSIDKSSLELLPYLSIVAVEGGGNLCVVENGVGYIYLGLGYPWYDILKGEARALWYIDSLPLNAYFRSNPTWKDIQREWKSLISVLRHPECVISEKLAISQTVPGTWEIHETLWSRDILTGVALEVFKEPYLVRPIPERIQPKLEADHSPLQQDGYRYYTLDIEPQPFWRKLRFRIEQSGSNPYVCRGPISMFNPGGVGFLIEAEINGHWKLIAETNGMPEPFFFPEPKLPVPPNISRLRIRACPYGISSDPTITYRIVYVGDGEEHYLGGVHTIPNLPCYIRALQLHNGYIYFVTNLPISKYLTLNTSRYVWFLKGFVNPCFIYYGDIPISPAQIDAVRVSRRPWSSQIIDILETDPDKFHFVGKYRLLQPNEFLQSTDTVRQNPYGMVHSRKGYIPLSPSLESNYKGTSISKISVNSPERMDWVMLWGYHRYLPQVFSSLSSCAKVLYQQKVSTLVFGDFRYSAFPFYDYYTNSGSVIYHSPVRASYQLAPRNSEDFRHVISRETFIGHRVYPLEGDSIYVPISLLTDDEASEPTPLVCGKYLIDDFRALVEPLTVNDHIYHNSILLSETLMISKTDPHSLSIKETLSIETTEWQIVMSEEDDTYQLISDGWTSIKYSYPFWQEVLQTLEEYGVDVSTFISEFVSTSQSIVGIMGRLINEYVLLQEDYLQVGRQNVVIRESFANYIDLLASNVFPKTLSESLSTEDKWLLLRLIVYSIADRLLSTPTFLVNEVVSRVFSEQIQSLENIISGFGHTISDISSLRSSLLESFSVFLVLRELSEIFESHRFGMGFSVRDSASVLDTLSNAITVYISVSEQTLIFTNVFLLGDKYDCWVLSSEALLGSIYTNFNFNSFAVLNNQCFAAKEDGIYQIGGESDAGTPFVSGLRWDLDHLGTHLKKRMYRAYFGVAEDSTPLLRVHADNKVVTYRIVQGRADISVGQEGIYWVFELEEINELNFIEIVPIILSR